MKQLILILGVVLLSGTDALTANLPTTDRVSQNLETYSLSSYPSTEVASNKADTGNSALTQEKRLNPVNLRGNHQEILVGLGPESGGGTPDDRGSTTTQSGGSK